MKSLDLGCGAHCRADIGVDKAFESSLVGLDNILESYGFSFNPNANLIEHNLNDLPLNFKSGTFDKVLLCHVLEHLNNPYLVLKEVKRLLKKGGEIIILVPDSTKNDADWKDKEHIFSWTKPSLEHLINKLFKIEESRVINEQGQDLLIVCKRVEKDGYK